MITTKSTTPRPNNKALFISVGRQKGGKLCGVIFAIPVTRLDSHGDCSIACLSNISFHRTLMRLDAAMGSTGIVADMAVSQLKLCWLTAPNALTILLGGCLGSSFAENQIC